ncbi:MAG: gfo/Idh/MocA family oxidoreductase [Bacteroidetes bacterium]|nr:MAG: gfo/Idh/MocA family oxidoreductase [Bacteroidota bacterium]
MTQSRIKLGIFGVGHLGTIHLKCLSDLTEIFEVVGFVDPDDDRAARASETFGIRRFTDPEALLAAVDAVDIVTPTTTHFDLATNALRHNRHLFIEKPVTGTVAEAQKLRDMAADRPVKIQVGHVERFNPAFLAIKDAVLAPMFIEGHRLATFNPRGTDVSVVLDLMIHDLDIVLKLVQSPVRTISASGVAVVSDTPDISNVRLEFENGCVANLTASRISLKQMRKIRLFQKDAYISLDFLDKSAQIVRLYDKGDPAAPDSRFLELDTPGGPKIIALEMPEKQAVNAIRLELETFGQAILQNSTPPVTLDDGLRALTVAHDILEQIDHRFRQYKSVGERPDATGENPEKTL